MTDNTYVRVVYDATTGETYEVILTEDEMWCEKLGLPLDTPHNEVVRARNDWRKAQDDARAAEENAQTAILEAAASVLLCDQNTPPKDAIAAIIALLTPMARGIVQEIAGINGTDDELRAMLSKKNK